MAAIEHTNTAPAATSLANRAVSLYSGNKWSVSFSIAVLKASAAQTRAITIRIMHHSWLGNPE